MRIHDLCNYDARQLAVVQLGNAMMPRSLTIRFEASQADSLELISLVRNFGEDAFRFLRENGWGMIDLKEVDRATIELVIREIKKSKLKRVESWVRHELVQQHLSATVQAP